MGFSSSSRSRLASALLLCLCILLCRAHGESRQLYIVYLGDVKHGHPDDVVDSHHEMLATLLGSKEESSASVVYNYKHGFSGFAAMLTPEQAKQLSDFPEVISVEPSKSHTVGTTRSWDFLGLNHHTPASGQLHGTNYGEDACGQIINSGEDVIIGVVDTGIWPESRSFDDQGYGPVPSRWKGKCQVGPDWGINNCSRKIIGARFYSVGISDEVLKTGPLSPRDQNGHGTHCASTAAGTAVEASSFNGLAEGVARGGVPRARIAVYKTFWGPDATGSGTGAGILAAIDDAIYDGVDVLSLSLTSVYENSFGALHAVQRGITVVYVGGNNGPRPQTVQNTSPWVITVAASKIDRSFPTVITLGNKQQIVGQSLYYQGKNSTRSSFTSLVVLSGCTANALNGTDVQGQILLCFPFPNDPNALSPSAIFRQASQYVWNGGGIGLIFAQYTTDNLGPTPVICQGIACVLVDFDTATEIDNYLATTSSPVAKIEPARTVTGKEILAPKVAWFSSRGPSPDYPDIIKPDIAAPGANILAAKEDSYVFMSGTSMAAPHVAGVVAVLKALHPLWSPAAIKSAIVTSAHVTDERGMPILAEALPRKTADPFDYSGDNINPLGAADPGLVYDIDPSDYTKFFGCTIVRRTSVSCNETALPAYHLNLPSISISNLRRPITMSRTVTNVGEVNSIYRVMVQSPVGVRIEVEPSVLVFDAKKRVHTFKVTLSPAWKLQGGYTFGSITWRSDQKTVRIPVAARITAQDFYADVA